MSAKESRHLLPMSSIIFNSSPDLRSPVPTNSTLVDLREAQDTTITALPMTTTITTKQNKGLWSRLVTKIKGIIVGKKKKEEDDDNDDEESEMEIGSPTDFKHEQTGGTGPLRTRASGESEWEDKEPTRRL